MSYGKIVILAAALLLAGCGRDMSSSTYTSGATAGKVLEGTIVSARPVTIKDHDKLSENTTGALAGGAGGAIAGSQVGRGSGSLAGALGGAVIGAVAGAVVQDTLSTSDGMEYLVKLDKKYLRDIGPDHKKIVRESTRGGVKEDIDTSIDTNLQTDILSVVQKGDPELKEGSRVFVIYSNDRPRLAPNHTK